MRHERFIHFAGLVAQHSTHPQFRMGAILTEGASIISSGTNKSKTHPRQIVPKNWKRQGLPSLHAELDTIIGVSRRDLRGASIYVARILANGQYGMARPCISCWSLLENCQISRVIYTTGNSEIYQVERI